MGTGSSIDWDFYIPNAKWTRRTAPMVLALLLERLKERAGPISYGELAELLCERYGEPIQPNKQKYGRPLGAAAEVAISEGLKWGIDVPPISLIVVNASTGYPGDGADQFVHRLNGKGLAVDSQKRRTILDKETRALWAVGRRKWEKLERLLGLDAAPLPEVNAEGVGPPPPPRAGGKGEGAAHAALKQWVVNHPGKFRDFGHFVSGSPETRILSGDGVDAMLTGPTARLAVEVKASNASDDELIRGLFQCVKYRATLQAEARVWPGDFLPGTALLVSTKQLSKRGRAVAEALGVRFIKVAMSCEKPR